MITDNDLLECGFVKCRDTSAYAYVDSINNNREFGLLNMYAWLYNESAEIRYDDYTVYPYKRRVIIAHDIEEINNIISKFDLCIDKYGEIAERFNNELSILNLLKK